MTITRRSFVLFSLCAAAQTASSQQGVASRDVKPQAAPAPSQRPFPAQLDGRRGSGWPGFPGHLWRG